MVFRQYRLLTILLALGVIASVMGFLVFRYSSERHNLAVDIAVDYSEVANLAGASHRPISDVLGQLKKAGATTLAVQEVTGAELVESGVAAVVEEPGPVTVLKGVPPGSIVPLSHNVADPVGGDASYALSLPYGLPKEALDAAKKAGMPVVARLLNYPGVRKTEVQRVVNVLRRENIHTVIFGSDQVLGYRGEADDVADALKAANINYGSVEFSKQKGDLEFSEKSLPNVIRVHSISATEMGTIDLPGLIERFIKGPKERNIRICYVRMFDFNDDDPVKANADYIRSIADGTEKQGFKLGHSHPFLEPLAGRTRVARVAGALVGLGVAAGLMLLVLTVFILPPRAVNFWTGVFGVVFAVLGSTGSPTALKMVALAAAIIFPTLSIQYIASLAPSEVSLARLKSYIWPAVRCFAVATAISMAGGLIIAGLLSRLSFMLHIQQFAGVKLASIAPIIILALVYVADIGWRADTWDAQKARAEAAVRRIASQPVLIWQTVLGLVILVMVALLVARSGNDSGVAVSALELKFRAILDKTLFIRPRTKEFLLGHPALILGAVAALAGRRNWAAVLLVIGAFGQIGLLNSFCHIHTPIAMSVIRGVIGAILGLIIAYVLLLIFARTSRNSRRGAARNVRKTTGVGQ